MEFADYLKHIARHFAHELEPIAHAKEITRNSELLGAFAEAAVRRLVNRMVSPLRVSTGGIMDYPIPEVIRQLDVIIWAPFPAPALYDVEGFGMVPRSSSFGVIEIKRSNYSKTMEDSISGFLVDLAAQRLTCDRHSGIAEEANVRHGLAVIPIFEHEPSLRLQEWNARGDVIGLFESDGQGGLRVRPSDVLHLVNFLHGVTWRCHVQQALPGFPQLFTTPERTVRR